MFSPQEVSYSNIPPFLPLSFASCLFLILLFIVNICLDSLSVLHVHVVCMYVIIQPFSRAFNFWDRVVSRRGGILGLKKASGVIDTIKSKTHGKPEGVVVSQVFYFFTVVNSAI